MNVAVSSLADQLLAVAGIKRVFSIDDEYAADVELIKVQTAVAMADEETRARLSTLLSLESDDLDVIERVIKTSWNDLPSARKADIAAVLTPPVWDEGARQSVANDLKIGSRLSDIFGTRLEELSLTEWKQRQGEIISAEMPSTLLLVDLNFTEEQGSFPKEGISIISQLLRAQPEAKIYCGLLTNAYHLSSIREDWAAVCAEYQLDRDRFVLLPKDSLNEDERDFLNLIKLVVMSGRAQSLTTAVRAAFEEFLHIAADKIRSMSVYDFDQIICLSSHREGIWEADTLVRVFSLFHKQLVRERLRNTQQSHQLTDDLRALSQVDLGSHTFPSDAALEIKRMEWYETAHEVNQQLLPIELGDLFTISGKKDKMYILVAQPCDLMVRSDGKRVRVENCMLLEVRPNSSEKALGNGYLLEDFFDNRDWRVSFADVSYVCLDPIDLCALRKDGKAVYEAGSQPSQYLAAAWRQRALRLAKRMNLVIQRYNDLVKGKVAVAEANQIAVSSALGSPIRGVVHRDGSSVTFNLERVARLRQPRAGALLSSYAHSLSRGAFEHDLVKRNAEKQTPDRLITAIEAPPQTAGDANVTSPG